MYSITIFFVKFLYVKLKMIWPFCFLTAFSRSFMPSYVLINWTYIDIYSRKGSGSLKLISEGQKDMK